MQSSETKQQIAVSPIHAGGRLLTAASLIAMLMVAAGSSFSQNQPQSDTQHYNAGHWKSPEEVYAKNCGLCHDTGVGPVLKGRGLPPEVFVIIVRHGLNAMPAFRKTDIDDAMLDRLADMLSRSEKPADKAAKGAGK